MRLRRQCERRKLERIMYRLQGAMRTRYSQTYARGGAVVGSMQRGPAEGTLRGARAECTCSLSPLWSNRSQS
eukprot:3209956-Pleurochrysis_carterae.AAC.1